MVDCEVSPSKGYCQHRFLDTLCVLKPGEICPKMPLHVNDPKRKVVLSESRLKTPGYPESPVDSYGSGIRGVAANGGKRRPNRGTADGFSDKNG
jgi:hypothetical protein